MRLKSSLTKPLFSSFNNGLECLNSLRLVGVPCADEDLLFELRHFNNKLESLSIFAFTSRSSSLYHFLFSELEADTLQIYTTDWDSIAYIKRTFFLRLLVTIDHLSSNRWKLLKPKKIYNGALKFKFTVQLTKTICTGRFLNLEELTLHAVVDLLNLIRILHCFMVVCPHY